MTREKKALRERKSTRDLMGIERLTDHGVMTARGELAFYLVQPDNLSVMSREGVRARVEALKNLLCRTETVHIVAMNSRESYQPVKEWYRQRLAEEDTPQIRALLEQDMAQLDALQTATASAREFALIYPLEKGAENYTVIEKTIRDHGFRVRLADRQDVKRILAVYYQQDITTEWFSDYDGEEYDDG